MKILPRYRTNSTLLVLSILFVFIAACDGLCTDLSELQYVDDSSGDVGQPPVDAEPGPEDADGPSGDCSIDDDCPDDHQCVDEYCVAEGLQCDDGLQACGAICIDITSHDGHCGGCGISCRSDEYCHESHCDCRGSLESCAGDCVDISSDPDHCGECGSGCADDEVCAAGICTDEGCPDGTKECNGGCFDVSTSIQHCQDCNQACDENIAGAEPICTSDGCDYVCDNPDEQICAGNCVDTSVSIEHCQDCNQACDEDIAGADPVCTSDGCDYVCSPPFDELCDDVCVDTSTDVNHCGGCDEVCDDGQLCADAECVSPTWIIEVVDEHDENGSLGTWPSVALDSQHRPHLSYPITPNPDENPQDVRHARLDADDNWKIDTVETGIDLASALLSSSLGVDSSDHLHVVFNAGFHIDHAENTTGDWEISPLATFSSGLTGEVGGYNAMTVDGDDNVHVVFGRLDDDNRVVHAQYNGTEWIEQPIDERPDFMSGYAIDHDANDELHVSYIISGGADDDTLSYGYYDGATWNTETATALRIGLSTSIAADSQGGIHIAFRDNDDNNLMYAFRDPSGGEWSTEIIDEEGNTGSGFSIAVDSEDRPRISFRNNDDGVLQYAAHNGEQWTIDTIMDSSPVDTALVIDANDIPHIAVGSSFDGRLEYVTLGIE